MKTLLLLGFLLLSDVSASGAPNLTALWANNGEDKVTRDELRASRDPAGLSNGTWDGSKITLFGARNEVVAFNLIMEAAGSAASNVTVRLDRLTGPSGAEITATPASGNGVFDWTRRQIELFYVRYLPIKGLSRLSYDTYDERHIPRRLRRPGSRGTWQDRPDHDKFYPEIAVPMELVPNFTIAAGTNQSVWVDLYIPKGAPPGLYQGEMEVKENGGTPQKIPIRLHVYGFTLPETPSAKTMLYFSSTNINRRYMGSTWIDPNSANGAKGKAIRDRHFLLAHRHRFSLIGDSPEDCASGGGRPCPEWEARLNGTLFTPANGYDGPGVNVGNNVYSIETYGSWNWKSGGRSAMNQKTDTWETWFRQNSPSTERFLYLIDESSDTAQIETWGAWMSSNPGPGGKLRSMATIPLTKAAAEAPSLDIPVSTLGVGVSREWQPLVDRYTRDARKRFYMYNGSRPATGSTATEDDGVALRQRAWTHFKFGINRWFFWETTYYNDYQGGSGEGNLFQNAHTFGSLGTPSALLGETGWNYSNGDGVLFYPGTDVLFPADSYGIDGPFASLRLKHWRRGLQDVDYLTLASAVNPATVQSLVTRMVPKAAWEYGVSDPGDPTYVLSDISWTDDPQAWEAARRQLADLIGTGAGNTTLGTPGFTPTEILGLDSHITATPPTGAEVSAYNWSFVPLVPPPELGTFPASGPPVNFTTGNGRVALAGWGLTLGYYQVSVTVTDALGRTSPPAQRNVALMAKAPQSRVFPNPWRADRHEGASITFEQPSLLFNVEIMKNFSGHQIKTLTSSGGKAVWDLTGDSGSKLSSDTYIYLIKSQGKITGRGKVAIIR